MEVIEDVESEKEDFCYECMSDFEDEAKSSKGHSSQIHEKVTVSFNPCTTCNEDDDWFATLDDRTMHSENKSGTCLNGSPYEKEVRCVNEKVSNEAGRNENEENGTEESTVGARGSSYCQKFKYHDEMVSFKMEGTINRPNVNISVEDLNVYGYDSEFEPFKEQAENENQFALPRIGERTYSMFSLTNNYIYS